MQGKVVLVNAREQDAAVMETQGDESLVESFREWMNRTGCLMLLQQGGGCRPSSQELNTFHWRILSTCEAVTGLRR